MRYALVDANDVVVNVIELEDTAQYTPAKGLTLVAGRDWPAPAQVELQPVIPETISDRQFYQQLAVQGIISQDDALAAVCVGTIPAAIQNFITSLPDAAQQFNAKMLLA